MSENREDREIRQALRAHAPPAVFEEARIRARVEASLGSGSRWARAGRATLRAAAAIGLFTAGVLAGRASWAPEAPVGIGILDPGADLPVVLEPDALPLTIQASGTDYVSSVAMLSDLGAALTPEQRVQAREVAVAVLAGAIAELLLSDGTGDPQALLRAIARDAAFQAESSDRMLWR